MRKYILYFTIVIALIGSFAGIVQPVQAATVAELQAQLTVLLEQVAQLQKQIADQEDSQEWCHDFHSNLRFGMKGNEVHALQTALNKHGFSVPVTSSFDEQTASAVVGFQQKYQREVLTPHGLRFGTGFVGTTTRSKLNSLYECDVVQEFAIPDVAPHQVVTTESVDSVPDSIDVIEETEEVEEPSISLVYPKDTYVWYLENPNHEFVWSALNFGSSPVWIYLQDDKDRYILVASRVSNTGSYVLPKLIPTAGSVVKTFSPGSYKALVCGQFENAQGAAHSVCSNRANITIASQGSSRSSITITSPKAGDTWQIGRSYTVEWVVDGSLATRTVHLKRAGDIDKYLGSTDGNQLSYTVPSTIPIGQHTLFVCGRFCEGISSDGVPISVTAAYQENPAITSVEYSPGSNEVSEQFIINGKNFQLSSKLYYVDMLNPEKKGYLSNIQLYNSSKLIFTGNVYTSNIASAYIVQVVSPNGDRSNQWVVNTRGFKKEEPVSIESFTVSKSNRVDQAVTLQWKTNVLADTQLIATCQPNFSGMSFYTKEGEEFINCSRKNTVLFEDQNSNELVIIPRGNTEAVSVNFFLSALDQGVVKVSKGVSLEFSTEVAPDLIVKDVQYRNLPTIGNDRYAYFDITIQNVGEGGAVIPGYDEEGFYVEVYKNAVEPENVIARVLLTDLGRTTIQANGTYMFKNITTTQSADLTNVEKLRIVVDAKRGVYESNETNNTFTTSLTSSFNGTGTQYNASSLIEEGAIPLAVFVEGDESVNVRVTNAEAVNTRTTEYGLQYPGYSFGVDITNASGKDLLISYSLKPSDADTGSGAVILDSDGDGPIEHDFYSDGEKIILKKTDTHVYGAVLNLQYYEEIRSDVYVQVNVQGL